MTWSLSRRIRRQPNERAFRLQNPLQLCRQVECLDGPAELARSHTMFEARYFACRAPRVRRMSDRDEHAARTPLGRSPAQHEGAECSIPQIGPHLWSQALEDWKSVVEEKVGEDRGDS